MKPIILAIALLFPALAFAEQASPPSGALQLLGRCTQESANLIDQITRLEAELAKAPPAEAPASKPAMDPAPDKGRERAEPK